MEIKVERQLRGKAMRTSSNSNPKWSPKEAKYEEKKSFNSAYLKENDKDQQKKRSSSTSAPNSSSRHRYITCFKCRGLGHYALECSNKRTMVDEESFATVYNSPYLERQHKGHVRASYGAAARYWSGVQVTPARARGR
ncbi:hypothetical protein PIB30_064054 [Stylosanthes scabra]|uniref:CCHC-type domain-containing protein n=1 Tax=Stylosanthes scabra TaxID=79078 RepID=A0ABU6ZKB3_9FABA|nr:hypothetical protein [Stylosanthes scabra]